MKYPPDPPRPTAGKKPRPPGTARGRGRAGGQTSDKEAEQSNGGGLLHSLVQTSLLHCALSL